MAAPRRREPGRRVRPDRRRRSSRPAPRRASSRSVDAAAATPGTLAGRRRVAQGEDGRRARSRSSARRSVGPAVGKDLRRKGLLGRRPLLGARCSPTSGSGSGPLSFGTGAVVALVHDTWIALGLCSIFGVEISLTVVAAFLTLIGYSANDTVVIYDRIRENLEKPKKEPLALLVNRSINETLSRTFLTAVLTFLTVAALFFLGGEVIRGVRVRPLRRHVHRRLLDDLHRGPVGRELGDLEGEARRRGTGPGRLPRRAASRRRPRAADVRGLAGAAPSGRDPGAGSADAARRPRPRTHR